MPPALLLKGDKNFYGELKPTGAMTQAELERPAPPPNPMSNVKLSNPIQRENAVERITADINNPENLGSSENPTFQGQLQRPDINKLQDQPDSIGQKITRFLTAPIVEVSDTDRENQKRRAAARIVGDEAIAPATNEIRPVGEVPAAAVSAVREYVDNKLFIAVVIVGGIYLAGQFLQGAGKSIGKSKKSED
jgi:hypothetical protein